MQFQDYISGNRLIAGPDDPMLDPWLGKPLHGRDAEIKELADLIAQSLTDVQVVHPLVLAEGGVGKTELCKAAIRRYLRAHPFKKVWFISLEAASAIGDLWQRMAEAIGLENLRSEAELLAALPEGVFYLDNLESLIEVPNLAQHLRRISQKPGLRMLASSRSEIPGWGKTFDLETLSPQAAVALFSEVWEENGAAPLPADALELETFVTEDLGCLPLAVVLVAAQGRFEHTLPAVVSRWREEGAAAAKRPGLAAEVLTEAYRLDSLEHSIRLSLHRLPAPARLLWGMAAFFPDGLPLDFLEELLRGEPALRNGRDQLLLHRILHRQNDGRLRISPPLARFARDLASRDEEGFEAAGIFERISPWLTALGNAAKIDREGAKIRRLLEEFPSMEAVVLFYTLLPNLPLGMMYMLSAWSQFYWRRIFIGKKILEAVLTRSEVISHDDLSWILESAGTLARLFGDDDKARKYFEEALRLNENAGNTLGRANTLEEMGLLALNRDENEDAKRHLESALELYEVEKNDLGKANSYRSLGEVARRLGDASLARERYNKALSLYEKEGSDLGKANSLRWLGYLEKQEGNFDEAKNLFADALEIYAKIGDPIGEGYCHFELARAAHRVGDLPLTKEYLKKAQSFATRAGVPQLEKWVEEFYEELEAP